MAGYCSIGQSPQRAVVLLEEEEEEEEEEETKWKTKDSAQNDNKNSLISICS
jgi:hypothetical protein